MPPRCLRGRRVGPADVDVCQFAGPRAGRRSCTWRVRLCRRQREVIADGATESAAHYPQHRALHRTASRRASVCDRCRGGPQLRATPPTAGTRRRGSGSRTVRSAGQRGTVLSDRIAIQGEARTGCDCRPGRRRTCVGDGYDSLEVFENWSAEQEPPHRAHTGLGAHRTTPAGVVELAGAVRGGTAVLRSCTDEEAPRRARARDLPVTRKLVAPAVGLGKSEQQARWIGEAADGCAGANSSPNGGGSD